MDWKHLGNTKATIKEVEVGLRNTKAAVGHVLVHDKPTTVSTPEILIPRLKAAGYDLVNCA